ERISIRFDFEDPVTLSLPTDERIDTVLSDAIKGEKSLIVFADKDTVAGISPYKPSVFSERFPGSGESGGAFYIETDGYIFLLLREGERFVFLRSRDFGEALKTAKEKIKIDIEAVYGERIKYFENKPPCKDGEFEKLYYKCLSVNKVNVYSPQGGITCRSTTPDRLPHKHVWLWDSMFHAMAISSYDTLLAKESILAVLQCQRDDGFIPHMMESKTEVSDITQPQVIAWAALSVYRADKDKEFLALCAGRIEKFLLWFLKNRDKNGNGLTEWHTDYANTRCRCDESGMDNSPRFDTLETLDAIDSSCFMASDCKALSEIYKELGDSEKSGYYLSLSREISDKINELLWDEEEGIYCDREFSGKLTHVSAVTGFLPLFAGVCDERRAAKLRSLLTDSSKFSCEFPVPSIALDNPLYGADMWRGCTWINYNFMIILGLRKYGYDSLAEEIRLKTLRSVNSLFLKTGNIYEFYDSAGKTEPMRLNRKGPQPGIPDYRVKYHSITDYNWTASLVLLMIQNDFDRFEI
ncbi:hypothetical protein IKP13_09860, partial [bacterium]|nr:hypothetical protein [bacterium]